MDVALDTNAVSAYFGGDAAVASAIRNASFVLMFPFVVGELEAGFRGGNRYEPNKKVLRSFLSEPNFGSSRRLCVRLNSSANSRIRFARRER